MKRVIEDIQEVLAGLEGYHDRYVDAIVRGLKDKSCLYKKAYPIAVVHDESRIDDAYIVKLFRDKGLLDSEGLTPEMWSRENLEFLQLCCEAYVQESTIMALDSAPTYPRVFTNKYPKDRWKKFQDAEHVIATIETAAFGEEADKCAVEFYLREVMRKRKEVSVLKEVGYLYIAQVPLNVSGVDSVFLHYFHEDVWKVTFGDVCYYLGWNAKLRDINMRYFVCNP